MSKKFIAHVEFDAGGQVCAVNVGMKIPPPPEHARGEIIHPNGMKIPQLISVSSLSIADGFLLVHGWFEGEPPRLLVEIPVHRVIRIDYGYTN